MSYGIIFGGNSHYSDIIFKIQKRKLVLQILVHMIYLLTVIGLTPGGSSAIHIYTQTIHRTIQNKKYIEQQKNFGRVRAVPCLS